MITDNDECQICAIITDWFISDLDGQPQRWEGAYDETEGTVKETRKNGVRLSHLKCFGRK
jgi:hypothetical protein